MTISINYSKSVYLFWITMELFWYFPDNEKIIPQNFK